MKNKLKKIYIFLPIFSMLGIVALLKAVTNDNVWTYGFSYNIAKGLIPYKDFNMVIGPLYSLLCSVPIRIFGNYLVYFKLFHIIIYSLILMFVYKKINKKTILLILFLFIPSTFCIYNDFIAMLTVLILVLLDSDYKYREQIIAFIIGFILMTKHNVGLILFIIFFLTSKQKKNIIYSLIPIGFSIGYLLFTNSFKEYIDICFLGMGSFLSNLKIEVPSLIIIVLLFIYYVHRYIKIKDIKILYILGFLIISFPIIESEHLLVGLIPVIYYILKEEYNTIIYKLILIFIILGLITSIISLNKNELIKDNNFLKYNLLTKGINSDLKNYSKYLNSFDDNTYLFIKNAYILRLYNNKTTSFYDLINKGNLGSDENKYIDKISKNCSSEKCIFILDKVYFDKDKNNNGQLSSTFKKYVIENYDYVETIPSGDRLYSNEKRINN